MSKIIENYKLQEVIGSGQFGKVYKGVQLINQKLFAIKQVKNSIFEANPKLKEFTVNEIKTLSQIDSPHVVKFKEMLKTTNNVYFVYEYCNGGTLDAQITLNGYFPEEKALGIFKQLLLGFKEVNKLNIIHRDLKPQNILFHNQIVKIGDFGFCKQLERREEMVKTMLGSPIYMAPEVLNGQDYCIKADIWSLGVVLYEMLYGVCPFTAKSIASLIMQIENNDLIIPTQINVSNQTKQLLTRMLTKNHKNRISWEELFELPQFQDQSPKKIK